MNIKEQFEIYTKLKEIGQSLWLDSINRDMILNKFLSNLVENYQITGLTSNPTIFENAILNSSAYDESIRLAVQKFKNVQDIAYSLMIEDIQRACDILKKVYEDSNGNDGYASIEIPPTINEISQIIECAKKIYEMVDRPNLMIKIPSTEEGIKAEEELLKQGINVNMTLIFSPSVYEKVVDAYISAVKWREENNLDPRIFSVASFFVSRIDSEISKELEKIIISEKDIDKKNEILMIKGKPAIAISLIAYETYLEKFFSDNFKKYIYSGFKPQKLLWASTSTKDPSLRDTLYVDELCLPHTINTLPQQTLFAFFEHGKINSQQSSERIKEAHLIYKKLESYGVIWENVFDNLLDDGIKRFQHSYQKILKTIEDKIANIENKISLIQVFNMPLKDTLDDLKRINFSERFLKKDPSLWKEDKKSAIQIKNSLGWINIPAEMEKNIKEIINFRDNIIKEGYRYVVLLGMGGSSLASEVISSIFGHHKKIKLYILDSTDPQWINRLNSKIKIEKTMFIVSSKSGTTLETISHFKYFFNILKKKTKQPGKNFIAITDKNTPLEITAKKYSFRKVFINPSDIGGRFSALSYFGMVPASFTQCDIEKFILKAESVMDEVKSIDSASVVLGSFMGKCFSQGRDKLTLIVPSKLQRFGLWVEQLIAESTGKEGKGILPIIDSEIYDIESYSNDRFFVVLSTRNFIDNDEKIAQLIKKGFPVLKIYIDDIYDIAANFYRWEIATSVAAHIMKINPFDQPDVQFTKDFTKKILESKNVVVKPQIKHNKLDIYYANINVSDENDSLIWNIIENFPEKGYISFCAYIDESKLNNELLYRIKKILTEKASIPTVCVYGPRYLHSIGQLFKGGPDNGISVILTYSSKKDIKILGEKLSFSKICRSQAWGDFLAMKEKKRKVVMVDLKTKDPSSFLKSIIKELDSLTSKEDFKSMEVSDMPKIATKTSTRKNTTTVKTDAYVVIDYPKHQETITSSNYTIRIGASQGSRVEVSIDGGPWMNARESVGYWWYDWYNITPGNHEIIARIQTPNGSYITSKRRRCKAVL